MKKSEIELILKTATEEQAVRLRILHAAVIDSMKAYNQTHKPKYLTAWKTAEKELERFCDSIKYDATAPADPDSLKKTLLLDFPTDAIAQVFGVSRRRIRQFANLGMPKAGRNAFRLPDCVQWYAAHLRDSGQASQAEFQKQRNRLLKAKADRARSIAARDAEVLVPAEDVKAVWSNHIVAAKTKLLGMPTKLAPVLTDISDPAEIQQEVKRLVYEVLEDLAKDKPRLTHVAK